MAVPLPVTLYTKPGCHLCTQLQDDLGWLQRDLAAYGQFEVTPVDITTDARLDEQFRVLIPVLEVVGVLYYPPHDLLHLRRTLLTAIQAQPAA